MWRVLTLDHLFGQSGTNWQEGVPVLSFFRHQHFHTLILAFGGVTAQSPAPT
jgi:hypothetical protein